MCMYTSSPQAAARIPQEAALHMEQHTDSLAPTAMDR